MKSGRIRLGIRFDRSRRNAVAHAAASGLLDIIPESALAFDARGFIAAANPAAGRLLNGLPQDLIGCSLEAIFPQAGNRGSIRKRLQSQGEYVMARKLDGETIPTELILSDPRKMPGDLIVAILRDVSRRLKADSLRAAESRVLEMIAAGTPLEETLATLALGIEDVCDGMKASILLMGGDGRHLVHAAGPSLPTAYVAATQRVPIGPKMGSCGTAAFRKTAVFVRDIALDPLWSEYRQLALSHGLRACWSSPILATDRSVLGTFALYYGRAKSPTEEDLDVVARATHLAGIAIGRDLVEGSRRATEGRYRMLSELTSDFAYAFSIAEDGSAKLDWVTDAFARITGYEAQEWESMGAWRGLVHPDDLPSFESRMPRLARGEEVSSDVRIVTKDARIKWLSVFSRPVWNDARDRILGVVGAAQDFTTRKEAEDAKTMFLATASHELKTPLTVIQGFAQLMGTNVSNDVRSEAVEAIERRARELNKILERILLSSRIETGRTQVAFSNVNISAVLAERVAALRTATGRDVALLANEFADVRADPDVVTTVVDHLLDNAVKYSPSGGRILVSAGVEQDNVWVSVSDCGIGMTAEQVARCFDKFWQAESSDVRRFGGTGIGLFIVRSLVEAMGGEVRVESVLGAGTTFRFSLGKSKAEDVGVVPTGTSERTAIREFMRQIGIKAESA